MKTLFAAHGPFDIPFQKRKGGWTLTDDDRDDFSRRHNTVMRRVGCYIFGIRAGRGLTPAYVGKATRSFEQEVFTDAKLHKYQDWLADYAKGTPIMFFLIYPSGKRGKVNSLHINQLEKHLISAALLVNPDLLNIQGTKAENWGISGVLRCPRGKRSESAKELKRFLKL